MRQPNLGFATEELDPGDWDGEITSIPDGLDWRLDNLALYTLICREPQ